jgi:uncharacterized protein involved in outer membrane biogenesis
MKKLFLGLSGFFLLLILSLVLVPIIFKNQVKSLLDKQIERNIDAQVFYDPSSFELSFFTNFPNLTLNLGEFGVVGRKPFEGDTLIAAKTLQIAIEPLEIVFGDHLLIKKIFLQDPHLELIILKDGRANWKIAKSQKEEKIKARGKASSKRTNVKIDQWTINQANITFGDQRKGLAFRFGEFSHSGSGDFSSREFDLETKTRIENIILISNGEVYLKNARFEADVSVSINTKTRTIGFKKNEFKINDFSFGIDGKMKLEKESQNYDLKFSAKNNSFKSLLSLVPAVYDKDFARIKTEGNLAFSGQVKGSHKGESYPAFLLGLKVEDAMFQFPGHDVPLSHININVGIKNPGGSLENTITNIKSFHFELGENPIDLKAYLKGFSELDVDAELHALLDLADISRFYPVQGLELRGVLSTDGTAKGYYSKGKMPNLIADLDLSNGYIKSTKLDAPVKDLILKAKISSPGGSIKQSSISLMPLKFNLAGNDISINGNITDFESFGYDINLDGKFDLAALAKLFPKEEISVSGIVSTKISSRGSYDLIKRERYDLLSSSGRIGLENIDYSGKSIANDLRISTGTLSISPNQIRIISLKGILGKSDFSISGRLSNYLGYFFQDQEILGQLNLNSDLLIPGEWLSGQKTTEAGRDKNDESVLLIPADINFTLVAKSEKVLYDDLPLSNFNAVLILNNGTLEMKRASFNTLGGTVSSSGYYDSRAPSNPRYSVDLNIVDLDIPQAYSSLKTISFLAPSSEKLTGKANSNFHAEGILNSKMEPLLQTIKGKAKVRVQNGAIKNVDLIQKMMTKVKLPGMGTWIKSEYILSNFEALVEVINGRVYFEPFMVLMNSHPFEFSGSYGLDGTLDYLVGTEFKPASLGSLANAGMSVLFGSSYNPEQVMEVDFKITGDRRKPKVNLLVLRPKGKQTSGEDPLEEAKKEAREKMEIERKLQEAVLEKMYEKINRQAEAEKRRKENEKKGKKERDNLFEQLEKQEGG